MFSYHLPAGIHDAWWLGDEIPVITYLVSLLLIYTDESLYEIVLSYGERSLYPVPR